MTISRRVKPAPEFLPPARLYLDDLEEIVGIFVEALTKQTQPTVNESEAAKYAGAVRDSVRDEPIKKKFIVNDAKICDEIQDLPKIAKSARSFELEVSKGWRTVELIVDAYNTRWRSLSLPDEEEWIVYRKLKEICDNRKSLLKPAFRAVFFNFVLGSSLTGVGVVLLLLTLDKLLKKGLPSGLALALSIFMVVLILIPVAWLTFTGSEIIFSYSSDHAAVREERAWKVIPVILSGIFGLIAGIAVTYLKHKYWP